MNVCPHIDVAEPERIAAILADPANYVWSAVDTVLPHDSARQEVMGSYGLDCNSGQPR